MARLVSVLLFLFAVVPCQAQIITVDDCGTADYNKIQDAITNSGNGDIIIIANGIYTGEGNYNINLQGKRITLKSANGLGNCIIDCQQNGRGLIFSSHEDSNTIIDGLMIINGKAPNDIYGDPVGGGIYCYNSSPKIKNCQISYNSANIVKVVDQYGTTYNYGKGGGLYCIYGSSPQIYNCIFSYNEAGVHGGGIYCDSQSNPVIIDSDIINNRAIGPNPTLSDNGSGGGVYIKDSSPIFNNCEINNNYSHYRGAGIYGKNTNTSIIKCEFLNNSIYVGEGGAIGIHDGSPVIDRCIFINNGVASGNNQGVLSLEGSSAKVSNSLFTTNKSQWCIYCNYGGNNIITNCTVVDNRHWTWGSAITCSNNGVAAVTNCICRGNSDGGGQREIRATLGGSVQVKYCNVEGGYTGEGNLDADPCFAPTGDYAIRSNSPCIDSGTNTPTGGLPLTDLDGYPRVADGNSDGISKVDIGAYEFTPSVPLIGYSPENFEFQMLEGGVNPSNQILSITNIRDGILNWNITSDCSWLQIYPDHGSSAGDTNKIILTVNGFGLGGGTYNCVLEILDPCAVNNPQKVDITLVVQGPEIGLSNNNFKFSARDGIEHANSQTLNIHNSGGGILHWSISNDCNWLKIEPNQGISTGEINEVTLNVDSNAISKGGYYTCEIVVSDPNAKKSTEKIKIEFDYNLGDFDADGDVDLNDLAFFTTYWLNTDCNETEWCHGADIDKNGNVDFKDFAKLAKYWLVGVE